MISFRSRKKKSRKSSDGAAAMVENVKKFSFRDQVITIIISGEHKTLKNILITIIKQVMVVISSPRLTHSLLSLGVVCWLLSFALPRPCRVLLFFSLLFCVAVYELRRAQSTCGIEWEFTLTLGLLSRFGSCYKLFCPWNYLIQTECCCR